MRLNNSGGDFLLAWSGLLDKSTKYRSRRGQVCLPRYELPSVLTDGNSTGIQTNLLLTMSTVSEQPASV